MFSDVMIMLNQTVTTMSQQKRIKQFLPQQKGKLFLISLTGISLAQKRQQTRSNYNSSGTRARFSSVKCIRLAFPVILR